MAKSAPADRVIWIDRGWQPAYIGFCATEKAWKAAMRHLGCPGEPYPASDGRCSTFERKAGKGGLTIIVTLNCNFSDTTDVEVAGVICHEATHVWQFIREHIGEKTPSAEFEAYSMQAIFQGLFAAYLKTRPQAAKEA